MSILAKGNKCTYRTVLIIGDGERSRKELYELEIAKKSTKVTKTEAEPKAETEKPVKKAPKKVAKKSTKKSKTKKDEGK